MMRGENMAYKEVKDDNPNEDDNSIIWDPQAEGEFIEGTYVDVEEEVGAYNSNLYSFEDGDKTIKVWGSKVLDGLMKKVSIGNKIMIKYMGIKKGKKQRYKDYKVFEDDGTNGDDAESSEQENDDFEVKDPDAANQIENYINTIRNVKGKDHDVTAWEIINLAEAEDLPKDDMLRLKEQLAEFVKGKKIPQGEEPK